MTIGLIPAFEEEANIRRAVRSLLEVGCGRVVVLDGAYAPPAAGGGPFLNGGCVSRDLTGKEARAAGAEFIVPAVLPRFGQKRQMLLELCKAKPGDYVLFLDADERAVGELPDELPDGHACILLRNLKPNDLPDMRAVFPRGDAGPEVPLLRLLKWSPRLQFEGRGRFSQGREKIRAYEAGEPLLPVLEGVEIHHVAVCPPGRVEEKRRFYAERG